MSFKDQVIKTNYHTHMYLCRHAKGTIEDYIKEAIRLGFAEIGMSDHAPWKELTERSVRMKITDYPIYKKKLEEAVQKYSNQITIYKGMEIEYFYNKEKTYIDLLKDMDYLVLGQHYVELNNKLISIYKLTSLEEMIAYKDATIEAINTGYFKFIAHPDIFLFSQKELTPEILSVAEEIILAAKAKKIPLEINANGIRKPKIIVSGEERYRYPRLEFWQLVKKHDALCILSSDAHKPEFLYDDAVEEAYNFSSSLALRVVEELSFD